MPRRIARERTYHVLRRISASLVLWRIARVPITGETPKSHFMAKRCTPCGGANTPKTKNLVTVVTLV